MELYNVLNECDYYPRSKYAPDLNPVYGDRKENINQSLAEVAHFSPSALMARHWIGSVEFVLDHPLHGEDEMFYEAAEEVERMRKEARA